jgi:nucleotide-binding universal stress UspA family protein
MSVQQTADGVSRDGRPVFVRVLCGVDGSPSALEAVHQAAVLAGPGAELDLVCVRYASGYGPNAQATIGQSRAIAALDEARKSVKETGAVCNATVIRSAERADALIERLPGHDLVAVGPHVRSRAGGIMLGSTASTLVHRSPTPVFLPRRPQDGDWRPRTMLVASDGTPGATGALDLATRIAAAHTPQVLLVCAGAKHRDSAQRQALAEQAAALGEACGTEVLVLRPAGAAHDELPLLAVRHAVSLIVLGSRGTTGLRSLGSVSERVAHSARCSVLVARGGGESGR